MSRVRVAIPSQGAGGLSGVRSGHFGQCDCFTFVDIAAGEIVEVQIVDNPPHEHGGCLRPVELLAGHNVDALVVAGMGARPLAGFDEVGIAVYYEGETADIACVVEMMLRGELPRMDARHVCGGH